MSSSFNEIMAAFPIRRARNDSHLSSIFYALFGICILMVVVVIALLLIPIGILQVIVKSVVVSFKLLAACFELLFYGLLGGVNVAEPIKPVDSKLPEEKDAA